MRVRGQTRGGTIPGLIALLIVSVGQVRAEVSIFRPKTGVPAFIEASAVFQAEIIAPSGLASNMWTVKLENDLRAWTGCVVEAAEYGRYVYNDSLDGWRLSIRVPADIAPELFSLTVSHPSGGSATNRRAASVVSALETNFYILHVADPHVLTYAAGLANGQSGSYGSAQTLHWAAPVFNLINPRFILATGDEVENGDIDTQQKYAWYLQALEDLAVPTLITRGNNDRGDFALWKASIGQPAYALALGSFCVFMNDTRGNEMSDWFTNRYAASFGDPGIKYRLLGQHFWANADARNPFAYSPPAGQYPDLMLMGHLHAWLTLQASPYLALVTAPEFSYGQAALFEFSRTTNGWACSNIADHGARNVVQAFGDWGAPMLTNRFVYPNDGSRDQNSAVLNNSLDFDFRDGRLRFLLRHIDGEYQVVGAEKLAEYDYADGSNTAVIVRVNIRRRQETEVFVSWGDTDGDGMPDAWEYEHFRNLQTATSVSDFDDDGQLDWEEYAAGTVPTNSSSALRLTWITADSGGSGTVLRWSSALARVYKLLRAGHAGDAFLPLATDVTSSPPENVYTDTLYHAGPSSFYRIGTRGP